MKIFLTGATGFFGGKLLERLASQNHEVMVLVRDKDKLKSPATKVVLGDLIEKEKLTEVLKGIEAVYHLAAIRSEWGFSWEEYLKTNVAGTRNLLEAAEENQVKKFIYCSSVFVSGYNQKLPADETNPYHAHSLYGQSKIEAEKLVIEFCQKNNLPFNVIRPTVTYGPGDQGMFYKICHLIQNGKFKIIGKGENKLHLCYLDDLIEGFIKVLTLGKNGQIYILASERPIILQELVQKISKHLNKKPSSLKIPKVTAKITGTFLESSHKILRIKKEPLITLNKVALLTDHQQFDITKAKNELGFQPKIDYDEGIKKTINWYKEHHWL